MSPLGPAARLWRCYGMQRSSLERRPYPSLANPLGRDLRDTRSFRFGSAGSDDRDVREHADEIDLPFHAHFPEDEAELGPERRDADTVIDGNVPQLPPCHECRKEERFGGGVDIIAEGAAPRSTFVLTKGMACRYRLLPDGRRQILTFLIPGDFYDLHAFLLATVDHSVATIVPTRLAAIERDTVLDIIARNPRIGAALWWSAMQEAAMLRERVVALGRRNAHGRVAYILCELVWRHIAIGARPKTTRSGCR